MAIPDMENAMTTDDEIEAEAKRPWQDVRPVDHSEAKEIASRLIAGSFHRSDKRPNFSIPCRPDHDDDCLIMGYIAQQEAANVAHARHVLAAGSDLIAGRTVEDWRRNIPHTGCDSRDALKMVDLIVALRAERRRPGDETVVANIMHDAAAKSGQMISSNQSDFMARAIIDAYGKLPSPPQITDADASEDQGSAGRDAALAGTHLPAPSRGSTRWACCSKASCQRHQMCMFGVACRVWWPSKLKSSAAMSRDEVLKAADSRHSSLAFAGPTWPRLEDSEYLIIPPHGWTCFHCGMTFTDFWAARGHFGTGHLKIKPRCIRRAELDDATPPPTPDSDAIYPETHLPASAPPLGAPAPFPKGGFETNKEDADWLTERLLLRINQTLRSRGLNADFTAARLDEFLLLSLDDASKRARKPLLAALKAARDLIADVPKADLAIYGFDGIEGTMSDDEIAVVGRYDAALAQIDEVMK